MSEAADSSCHGQEVRTVVLRRFAGEALEIVALALPPPVPSLEGPWGCQIHSRTDGDMQVYEVELPKGYAVRPVDWRRFATDLERVRALITTCVSDNTAEAIFEAWTEAFRAALTARLELALKDLASAIETTAVEVSADSEAGRLLVRVEFVDAHHGCHQLAVALADTT